MTRTATNSRGTMRAWVQREPGDPAELLRLETVPVPELGPGQLLVKVAAVGVSYGDLLLCRGEYQEGVTFPFTPGQELVGEVVDRHPTATTPIGARVIALPVQFSGGLAEYCVVDEGGSFAAGDALWDAEGAAFLIAFHTAWFTVHHRGQLRAGETLLVHAAAGAVGSACVQLGVAAGARVIAVAGGAEKTAICRKIGAHVVVDRRTDDFRDVVMRETDGRGADVVVDPVNGDVFDQAKRVVASEGRLVVVGFASGRIADLRSNYVLLKNISVVGVNLSHYYRHEVDKVRAAHAELLELHRRGAIEPLVHREVPFGDAPAAIADVPSTSTWGRTVVRPPDYPL